MNRTYFITFKQLKIIKCGTTLWPLTKIRVEFDAELYTFIFLIGNKTFNEG